MPKTLTHNEVIVDALRGLIQTNRDSEDGYRTAADAVREGSDLATVFGRYALQRARFGADLEQEVRTYGGDTEGEGTLAGRLRSGWIRLKSAITGGSGTAILVACEHGEQVTLEHYQDVLHEDLPEYLKEMIRQQHNEIQDALQHIRALQQSHPGS